MKRFFHLLALVLLLVIAACKQDGFDASDIRGKWRQYSNRTFYIQNGVVDSSAGWVRNPLEVHWTFKKDGTAIYSNGGESEFAWEENADPHKLTLIFSGNSRQTVELSFQDRNRVIMTAYYDLAVDTTGYYAVLGLLER